MFSIYYNKVIELLLPIALRKPAIKAYLNAVLKPFKSIYNTFIAYRLEVLTDITHTGQVIYLEHLLNLKYDAISQNIHIIDSDDPRLDSYFYNDSEGQEVTWLRNDSEGQPPSWLFNKVEFDGNNDFIVKIPSYLATRQNQISETINKYRQAGKRYTIETYEINP